MTAGIYSSRQKLSVLLITKAFGGQLARKAVAIENYPGYESISGLELLRKFEKHLRRQKIDIERDEVLSLKKSGQKFLVRTKNKQTFDTKAVIIASGADPRPLEVPGEKEFLGHGLSYCTTCDGPLFADKTVAVIGGGNSGFDAAIFLASYAKKIYILERGPSITADSVNQERARKTGKIEVLASATLKEIKGQKFVQAVVYEEIGSKKLHAFKVEGVFIEIGSVPATGFVKGMVDFNERNEIKIDPRTCATETPGLFAAGDVTDVKVKQIVVAAAEGAKAALAAYHYLQQSTAV